MTIKRSSWHYKFRKYVYSLNGWSRIVDDIRFWGYWVEVFFFLPILLLFHMLYRLIDVIKIEIKD